VEDKLFHLSRFCRLDHLSPNPNFVRAHVRADMQHLINAFKRLLDIIRLRQIADHRFSGTLGFSPLFLLSRPDKSAHGLPAFK
jgi:hypothetical protein